MTITPLLHCIEKLYKLPVTVQHLQDTGVGRTVNALRKYEGTVGDASKALVAKWKTMVADEESTDPEDDDDQTHPDVPEPNSDNSDLGTDKASNPDKPDKTSERHSHKKHDSKHNHHHSSESRSRENPRSKSEKKSSRSSQDSSREKREKNEGEKLKSTKEKERHSSRKESTQESQKNHKSDSLNKESKESNLHLSKENKQVNGSSQNRKRKHDSPNREENPSKRPNNSTDENSDAEERIHAQLSSTPSSVSSSMKDESPTRKIHAHKKDSKRDKHEEKSRSSHHKHRSDKSEEKNKSTRDHGSSSSSSSHHKSSKHEKERKPSSSSSSKSKDDKNKCPSKSVKKHLNGDEGIDCNSGATFAEALGMCSAPIVKKKSGPVSPSSPVMKSKAESNPSTSKPKSMKTEIVAKEDRLSLLAPNIKLEPLSVDLDSTLPEISTNYKPLPANNYLNNTVNRKIEEDKILNDAIYAKNVRTKVYSGNKSGYTSVPTLYDLCIRVLIDNIDALEATGGVPYDILKPVLEKATPDQLFMLEHHNPYLIEDTDSLWQFHCNRQFRNKQREEMESSREMYMRCLDEREAKLKTLTANIKESICKSVPLRSAKLAFVDNIVKPPRNVLRKQAKYGTACSSSSSDLKKKIITGVNAATNIAVPPPPMSRVRTSTSAIVKKTKAPLMAKALQLIKGRYRR
ncbi:transcription elongation factor B polypeptide 3 isoform X2 [Diachasmimorpha longicaudata]|uniref:transcription elongation factor B polypeptide 3 isoform X2 n=1 Tax=Diachasmimorpha longicaudata TaxID=58733 RepID=UPI0030B8DEFB